MEEFEDISYEREGGFELGAREKFELENIFEWGCG